MAGSSWHTFAASTTASATEVNQNFAWSQGDIAPHSNGVLANAQFNLGTSTAGWKNLFLDQGTTTNWGTIYYGTSTVFLKVANSTTVSLWLGASISAIVPNGTTNVGHASYYMNSTYSKNVYIGSMGTLMDTAGSSLLHEAIMIAS